MDCVYEPLLSDISKIYASKIYNDGLRCVNLLNLLEQQEKKRSMPKISGCAAFHSRLAVTQELHRVKLT